MVSPQGRRPTFAQVYTLTPQEAINLREDNLSDKMNKVIKRQILQQLEAIMRTNPFGQTFMTAGALIDESKEKNMGEIPRFQVLTFCGFLLTVFLDCFAL